MLEGKIEAEQAERKKERDENKRERDQIKDHCCILPTTRGLLMTQASCLSVRISQLSVEAV